MKNRKFTPLIVASSLLLPVAALGGGAGMQSSAKTHHDKSSSSWNSSQASGQIKAVKMDKMDQKKLTATNLMDREIHGANGQKIGKVKDITLASDSFSSSVRGQFASSSGTAAQSGSGEVLLLVELADEVQHQADYVAVPASRLSYDQENDRLSLDIPRSELASTIVTSNSNERDNSSRTSTTDGSGFGGTASVTTPVGSAGMSGSASTSGGSASAGVASSDTNTGEWSASADRYATTTDDSQAQRDTRRIEQALNDHDDLSEVASNLTVTQSGEAILITGRVDDADQKDRVLELAREQTDLDVRDYLTVASN